MGVLVERNVPVAMTPNNALLPTSALTRRRGRA